MCNRAVSLLDLPEESLVEALGHLPLLDLCRTAAACQTLRRVAADDRLLWRARCLDQFGLEAAKERTEGTWEQHWDRLVHRCGCELFNQKAEAGIGYLIEHHVLRAEPKAVADFLRSAPGLRKESIGCLLGKGADKDWVKNEETNPDDIKNRITVEDFYARVVWLYMSGTDFRDITIVEALHQLLPRFKLPGESQLIRRIINDFAAVYFRQNKHAPECPFHNLDEVFIAAYAAIMLNMDLHSPGGMQKMSKDQFLSIVGSALPGLPQEYGQGMYDRIRAGELQVADDDYTTVASAKS